LRGFESHSTERLTISVATSRFAITIREETATARDPIHPGRFLADELDALDMSVPEVAAILHVPANRIYQLLKWQRALTADTALRLSQWLGTSAEMWLNLQTLYELRLAEQQVGKKIKGTIVRGKRHPAYISSRRNIETFNLGPFLVRCLPHIVAHLHFVPQTVVGSKRIRQA
jgi:addiction module HigA family antidote